MTLLKSSDVEKWIYYYLDNMNTYPILALPQLKKDMIKEFKHFSDLHGLKEGER